MKKLINIIFNSLISNYVMGADLTCDENLSMEPSPFPCGDAKYGYPIGLIVGKPGTTITAVGAIPTVAEVAAALGLTTTAKLIALMPISDGDINPEVLTIVGPDDLEEAVNTKATITANAKYLNDTFIDKARQIQNIYKRVQLWWIDSEGRWYGGKTGYRASLIIPEIPKKEFGKATKAALPITARYYVNGSVTFATALDLGYLDLDNPSA